MVQNKCIVLCILFSILCVTFQTVLAGEIRQQEPISISPLIDDVQKLKSRVNALYDHLITIQNKHLTDGKDKKLGTNLRIYASAPYREIVSRAIKDIDNLYNQNI